MTYQKICPVGKLKLETDSTVNQMLTAFGRISNYQDNFQMARPKLGKMSFTNCHFDRFSEI